MLRATCLQRKMCKCLHNHDNSTPVLWVERSPEANFYRKFPLLWNSPHTTAKQQTMWPSSVKSKLQQCQNTKTAGHDVFLCFNQHHRSQLGPNSTFLGRKTPFRTKCKQKVIKAEVLTSYLLRFQSITSGLQNSQK